MLTALTKSPNFSPAETFSGVSGTVHDNRRQVGLLAGNDLAALIFLNSEIPTLVSAGFKPVIYMAEHKPSIKPEASQLEIQSLSFYERYLTNNVIFPIIDQMETPIKISSDPTENGNPREDILYTPNQLAEVYGLDISHVEDINSSEFVEEIKSRPEMPLVVSVRCYQIARQALIEAQKSKKVTLTDGQTINGAIWNMHPGKLPEYQGILGPLRAMNNLQRTYAWTLHEMIYDPDDKNKGIDKGPIITQKPAPIDYSAPAIDLYLKLAKPSADMLYDRIEDFFRNRLPVTPQNEYKPGENPKYYSHPKPKFFNDNERWPTVLARLIKLGDDLGFKVDEKVKRIVTAGRTEPEIVDFGIIPNYVASLFASAGQDSIYPHLEQALDKAVMDWESNKDWYKAAHAMEHPQNPHGVIDTLLATGKTLPNGYRLTHHNGTEYSSAQNHTAAPPAAE